MIIVTGAAGFIGSALVSKLNREGFNDVVLVDDFSFVEKNKNFEKLTFSQKVERTEFADWLVKNEKLVEFVFHLGARTDTAEFDRDLFDQLNLNYSKEVWNICTKYQIPLVYASSAATYGLGEFGYSDDHQWTEKLKPLNPYGDSKNDFDKWMLKQEKQPFFWAGLKFFNVYGPNEYHKNRMASVILHTFRQIEKTGKMKLFRSHNPEYKDGEQMRDFIYIKDVVNMMYYLMHNRHDSGIFNIGTGKARTFYDLAANTFKAMGKEPDISFMDTPEDIRDKYQYFTEAKMDKLFNHGFDLPIYSLEEGIKDYVQEYLMKGKYY